MNEDEKKAIELLKQEPDFSLGYYKREHAIDIVLNLIEKQQKEIEEYKELLDDRLWNEHISKETEKIWKDKIKGKIKYIEENYSEHSEFLIGKSIEFLQELLEEGDKNK